MDNDHLNKLAYGRNIAIYASVITAILAAAKYFIGTYYHSDVLVSDAFHSAADTAAILASAFGLYLSGFARSEKFPHGLYRAETLSLLFIALFIIYAGVDLIQEGVNKLFLSPAMNQIPPVPVITVIASMLISAGIAFFEIRAAKRTGSLSLKANARESFLDILSSFVVLGGIVLPAFRVPYIEGGVIIFIGILIIKIGIENSYRSILILLDANLDRELKEALVEGIALIKGVKAVEALYVREAGPFKMIEVTIQVSPSATVFATAAQNEMIKDYIKTNFDNIDEIMIKSVPLKSEKYRCVVPVRDINGLDSQVYGHFGRAPYYAVATIEEGAPHAAIDDFYLNEFLEVEKHVGLKVVKTLLNFNVDIIFTTKIGEISFVMLKDNLVDVYEIPDSGLNMQEIIELFLSARLKKMTGPNYEYHNE